MRGGSHEPPDPPQASLPERSDVPGASKGEGPWLRDSLGAIWQQLTEPQGRSVAAVAVVILSVGGLIFCAIPTLWDATDRWLAHLPSVSILETKGHEALSITTARAALYPLAKGGQALVVRGEVFNQSDQPQAVVDALLQLKDGHGFVLAQSRAPLGFSPRLLDIFNLADDQSWQSLVQQTRAIGRAPLAPQASAMFTLVVVQPPKVLADTTPEISLP